LCLLSCQDRYRRKYSESVSGQEDYVLCCRSCGNRTNDLLNVIDWVGHTCILCHALICKVDLSVCIQCHVLKKSVSLDGIVDIRLGVFVQVDNFCVASALEVEHAVVIPAMLVITDEKSLGICGQCCLTCSGKSEE